MLAAIHAGAINPPSIESLCDPVSRRHWGVDEAATVAVQRGRCCERPIMKFEFGGAVYELYRHPHLYITDEVTAWWQQYKWINKAGAAADYWETNPKFHAAANIYESFRSKFDRSAKNV